MNILQQISNIESAIFCHTAAFIAGTKTKDAAIKFCNLAISLQSVCDIIAKK